MENNDFIKYFDIERIKQACDKIDNTKDKILYIEYIKKLYDDAVSNEFMRPENDERFLNLYREITNKLKKLKVQKIIENFVILSLSEKIYDTEIILLAAGKKLDLYDIIMNQQKGEEEEDEIEKIKWKGSVEQLCHLLLRLSDNDLILCKEDKELTDYLNIAANHFLLKEANYKPIRRSNREKNNIIWLGKKTTLIYLFDKLYNIKLVTNDQYEHIRSLLKKHFCDEHRKDLNHLRQAAYRMDISENINRSDTIDSIIAELKEISQ